MPALLAVSLLWAFSFGLTKRFLSDADPFAVSALRLLLAFLALLPWWRPRLLPRRETLLLLAIGGVQFGVMYAAYNYCFGVLQAWQAALLTVLTPLWVVLFSDLLDRRWNWLPWLAAGLSCAGAALADGRSWTNPALSKGFWAMQLANVCFAAGQVAWSRWRRTHGPAPSDLAVFCWPLLGGALVTGFAAACFGRPGAFVFNASQWLAMAFLGVFSSGLAFYFWNRAASKVSPGALAVANNLKTPLGVFVSLTIFGEMAALSDPASDLSRLFAGLLIVVLALRLASRQTPAGETLARR